MSDNDRMYPYLPPTNLVATVTDKTVELSWTSSPETSTYHVYYSSNEFGPYTRLSGSTPVNGTVFLTNVTEGMSYYMVRGIRLETTPSGMFMNPSQGAFTSIDYKTPSSSAMERTNGTDTNNTNGGDTMDTNSNSDIH